MSLISRGWQIFNTTKPPGEVNWEDAAKMLTLSTRGPVALVQQYLIDVLAPDAAEKDVKDALQMCGMPAFYFYLWLILFVHTVPKRWQLMLRRPQPTRATYARRLGPASGVADARTEQSSTWFHQLCPQY